MSTRSTFRPGCGRNYWIEKVEKGELGFKSGGVGFRQWTPEEEKALRANLLDYLIKAVRQMKEKEAK